MSNQYSQLPWWSHYEALYYGLLTAAEHELFLSQFTSQDDVRTELRIVVEGELENEIHNAVNDEDKTSCIHLISTALVFGQLKHVSPATNDAH
jgi:hypothetical protein